MTHPLMSTGCAMSLAQPLSLSAPPVSGVRLNIVHPVFELPRRGTPATYKAQAIGNWFPRELCCNSAVFVNDRYLDDAISDMGMSSAATSDSTSTFISRAAKPARVVGPSAVDLLGVERWRNRRQVARNAAISAAAFASVAEDGESDVPVPPVVGFWEALRQKVDSKLATRAHNVRHRASNRFARRVRVVKQLVATLKFETHGFENTPNDRKALLIAAKGVVERAIKAGELGIATAEANWYKMACVALYYHRSEDDELFESLIPALKKGSA